jgi:hypothetical protein
MADGQSRWLGALDVLAKIGIGVVGAWATWHFARIETEREAQRDRIAQLQERAADERELMRIFADYAPKSAAIETLDGRSALALTAYAAERLAADHGRPEFVEMLPAPTEAQVSSAVAENPQAAVAIRNAAVQAREAQATQATPMAQARWFAVAATFPADQPAAAESFAAGLRDRLKASDPNVKVAVWRTRTSRNLAICVGGPMDPEAARETARSLRANGAAPDAFAQRDREWERVSASPAAPARPSRALPSAPD